MMLMLIRSVDGCDRRYLELRENTCVRGGVGGVKVKSIERNRLGRLRANNAIRNYPATVGGWETTGQNQKRDVCDSNQSSIL